ncbi:Uncharacterized protein TCM_046314 [Theobroma cacao]|uniref:Uncharacterized protein n=1 Tax=Theobroma cacao TaxID=3641 RepID=S1RWD2_THECC|nr:Uncharacterized protein TCM_046314 [Theobroma cacao]
MKWRLLPQSPQPRCSRPLFLMLTILSPRLCHRQSRALSSLKEMVGLEVSRRLLLVKAKKGPWECTRLSKLTSWQILMPTTRLPFSSCLLFFMSSIFNGVILIFL